MGFFPHHFGSFPKARNFQTRDFSKKKSVEKKPWVPWRNLGNLMKNHWNLDEHRWFNRRTWRFKWLTKWSSPTRNLSCYTYSIPWSSLPIPFFLEKKMKISKSLHEMITIQGLQKSQQIARISHQKAAKMAQKILRKSQQPQSCTLLFFTSPSRVKCARAKPNLAARV